MSPCHEPCSTPSTGESGCCSGVLHLSHVWTRCPVLAQAVPSVDGEDVGSQRGEGPKGAQSPCLTCGPRLRLFSLPGLLQSLQELDVVLVSPRELPMNTWCWGHWAMYWPGHLHGPGSLWLPGAPLAPFSMQPILTCPTGKKVSSMIIAFTDGTLEPKPYEETKFEVSSVHGYVHFPAHILVHYT